MNRTNDRVFFGKKVFFYHCVVRFTFFNKSSSSRKISRRFWRVLCEKGARTRSGTFLFGEKITARAHATSTLFLQLQHLCVGFCFMWIENIWGGADGFWSAKNHFFFYHFFLCSSMETPPGPRDTTISSPPITDNVWKKSYLRKSLMGLYEGMVHHALK